MTLLIAAGVAVCVGIATLFVTAPTKKRWVDQALDIHRDALTASDTGPIFRSRRPPATLRERLLAAPERWFGATRPWRWLERTIARAGMTVLVARVVWISVGAFLGAVLVAALASVPIVVAVLVGLVAAAIPSIVVSVRAAQRKARIELQLPEFLNTMAALLKGGQGLRQALQNVADEGTPPLSDELAHAMRDVELGLPIQTALEQLAERIGSDELEFIVVATTIQLQAGGGLAALYEQIADTVLERHQFVQRARALTAQGRWSGRIMMCLPPLTVIWLSAFGGKDYSQTLFHTRSGAIILMVSSVLLVLGIISLQSLARVKR